MKLYEIYLEQIQQVSQPKQSQNPVQKPRPSQVIVKQPNNNPKPKQPKQIQQDNGHQQKVNPKSFFDYMTWTSKIIKQGEIFRNNCDQSNCNQYQIGTAEKRICKNRCTIEGYKKIIQMLKVSMNKCSQSNVPQKCQFRYRTLIPLYQEKLNKLSSSFIAAEKRKKKSEINVG